MTGVALSPATMRFTVVLGLLAAIPSLSIDVSAPTLLVVQRQLAAPAGTVGLTITLFMLGFAAGQFGSGPLSDRYGRRPMLLTGLLVYTVAAAACALSGGIVALVAWRLMQGIAAGGCAVLAFAMIRDLFDGETARRKRSYVTVVFGLAPMLAPSIGAFVLDRAGWRPVFMLLAAFGTGLFVIALLWIGESRRPCRTAGLSLPRAYAEVLSCRRFVGLAVLNALSFGGMFAYIAGSPLVLMGGYGLSAETYGLVFAATAAALTFGAWLSGRSVSRAISPAAVLGAGLVGAAASGLGVFALLVTGNFGLTGLIPLLLVHMVCRGLVSPNAQHLALEPMAERAGTAAAAVGVIQILMGAMASLVVTMSVPSLGSVGMGAVMAALALASLLLFWSLPRPGTAASGTMASGAIASATGPARTAAEESLALHAELATGQVAVPEAAV